MNIVDLIPTPVGFVKLVKVSRGVEYWLFSEDFCLLSLIIDWVMNPFSLFCDCLLTGLDVMLLLVVDRVELLVAIGLIGL